MDELVPISTSILHPNVINQCNSWEEFVSTYLSLDEVSSISSWLKADLLLRLSQKFPGEQSLREFGRSVGQPGSTIINYVRTSLAFPLEKRIPVLTFSHHFQCSWVDELKDGKFKTEKRFELLEKVVNEKWSTRQVQDEIKRLKEKEELQVETLPCQLCKGNEPDTYDYIFYSPSIREKAHHFMLHKTCFDEWIEKLK